MSYPDEALDDFYDAYVQAALWSTNDESTPEGGEPFDLNYGPDDVHPDSQQKMLEDCSKFMYKNRARIKPEFCNRAAGWEKGIVEKNVQDRRRGIWLEAAERRWPRAWTRRPRR